MEQGSLRSFYISELKKIHAAETQLTTGLESAAKASSSAELRRAFEKDLEQTKDHAARIQMMLEALGQKSEDAKSSAMQALIADMQNLLQEGIAGATLDAALIAYAQRIEHYEIATYGTLCDYATALGERDTAYQLQNTLEEEQQTARLLSKIGQVISTELARQESAEKEAPQLAVNNESKTRIKPAA